MIHDITSYYNATINKGNKPVSFNWLKRQRIIKGREELNNRFGKNAIDFIFGEKTYLANAEDMLLKVEQDLDFNSLPFIGYMLYLECSEVLEEENPVRKKYSFLNEKIYLPILRVYPDLSLLSDENEIYYSSLKFIQSYLKEKYDDTPYTNMLYTNIQVSVFLFLKAAFEEIRKEIESITTKELIGD